jgi:hypothetical protein
MSSVHNCVKCGEEMPYFLGAHSMQDPFSVNVGLKYPCDNCGTVNFVAGTAMPTAFKFGKLKTLKPDDYMNHITHHAELYLVHKAFQDNMNTVLAFGKLPTYMKFHFEVFRKNYKTISRKAGITVRAGRSTKTRKPVPLSYAQTDSAFRFVPSEGMFIGLQGLLSVMLTSTWTAFEMLAGDLWEAALNTRQDRFAGLDGTPDRIQDEAERRGCQAVGQRTKLGKARDFANKNRKTRVGTLGTEGTHQRDNFVFFDSLMKMRAAYSCAFSVPSASIDDALCDQSLEALALVRNLLLHKAGIADDRYVKSALAIPGCPQIKIGDPIPLQGDLVAGLIKPVVGASMKLISAIDAEVLR